jgi:hypothetical protein
MIVKILRLVELLSILALATKQLQQMIGQLHLYKAQVNIQQPYATSLVRILYCNVNKECGFVGKTPISVSGIATAYGLIKAYWLLQAVLSTRYWDI